MNIPSWAGGNQQRRNADALADCKALIRTLRLAVQPIDGHEDPDSVEDCWEELLELIARL